MEREKRKLYVRETQKSAVDQVGMLLSLARWSMCSGLAGVPRHCPLLKSWHSCDCMMWARPNLDLMQS